MTYSFVPFTLPRPPNSLSPRIYSIFCLADYPRSLLRRWFHHTNARSTSMIVPSFLGPPWPARPGHLHSFVHRLTKEASPWCNPFNEIASIPSSLIQRRLFASDRRQTFHLHRSSVRLRPAIRPFGHSFLRKPVQGSERLCYLIPNPLCVVTYMVYHPSFCLS